MLVAVQASILGVRFKASRGTPKVSLMEAPQP